MKTIDELTSFSTPDGRYGLLREFECSDRQGKFKVYQLVGEQKYIVKKVGSPLGNYQTFEDVDFLNEFYGVKVI